MKTQQLNKKRMGFSLIELSIVILVIGILVLGITKGSLVINKAKLGSAKSLTSSAPVPLISDLVAWYEPTLDTSFAPSDISQGTTLSAWNDNSPYKSNNTSVGATIPTYNESAINNLPAVTFAAGATLTFNSLPLNGKYYTVFVVERRGAATAASTLVNLGTGAVLGYITDTTIGDSVPTTDSSATVAAYNANSLVPRISTFLSDSTTTKVFVNGTVGSATGSAPSTTITAAGVIGSANYVGNISEVIIYNRTLSVDDRNAIQNYLSKKYGIKVTTSA